MKNSKKSKMTRIDLSKPLTTEALFDLSAEELAKLGERISKLPGRPMTATEKARHDQAMKGPHRSIFVPEKAIGRRGRRKIGQGAQRVLITVEKGLLAQADHFARDNGVSRSQLIAEGLRLAMGLRKAG